MKKSINPLITISLVLGLGFALTKRSEAQSCRTNDLGQSISIVNHLAQSMLVEYSHEARAYGRCTNAANLILALREYKAVTDSLVRAHLGSCPRTLAQTACDTRTNLTRVQHFAKMARVGHRVRGQIQHSCPIVTRIQSQTALPAPVPHYAPNPVVPHNTHYYSNGAHRTHNYAAPTHHYNTHRNYGAPAVSRHPRNDAGQVLLQALMSQLAHRR